MAPIRATSPEKLIEIVGLDRRQFLRLAGGALIALGTLDLIGCGGGGTGGAAGGGGGLGTSMANVTGAIQLPSGFTTPMSQLAVSNLIGQSTLTKSGGFSANVANGLPSLVILQNAAGNGVLFGFVNSASASNVINAQSSAVVLLYFAFGVFALPPSVKAQVIE